LLEKLREAGQLDFSRAAVASSSVRAIGAAEKLARTPRIARDPVPNITSSSMRMASPSVPSRPARTATTSPNCCRIVDAITPIRGVCGRPLQKPKVIYADRGYDSEQHRSKLRKRGIKPVIAKRWTEHGSSLGKFRWVVGRIHAWLHEFRRLRIRFERRADIHEAFLKLVCSLVCWNIIRHTKQYF
jgi:transposase